MNSALEAAGAAEEDGGGAAHKLAGKNLQPVVSYAASAKPNNE